MGLPNIRYAKELSMVINHLLGFGYKYEINFLFTLWLATLTGRPRYFYEILPAHLCLGRQRLRTLYHLVLL